MKLYAAASIPVLLALLLAGYCGLILLEWLREGKRRVDWIYVVALAGYAGIYVYLTFLVREPESMARLRLVPFYSLARLLAPGETRTVQLFREILLNILLYVPMGSLLRGCLRHTRHPHLYTFLAGFGATILTEVMQYALRMGLAETDDVIHNCLGLIIGICGFEVAAAAASALRGRDSCPKSGT